MPRLDLLDPAVLADPYPFFHRLRADDPVHWEPEPGYWALSRYDDALHVLRETECFSSAIHRGSRAAEHGIVTVGWFAFLDGPVHARLRTLVGAAFTPEVVEGLRTRIAGIVAELLDAVADRPTFDVVAALAFPLPAIVIADLLGVPAADRERFRRWSADLAALGGILRLAADGLERRARARESGAALVAYFREVVRARRRAPGTDLVSALLVAREAGEGLTEDEIVDTCVFLLFAGHETTMNLIGNGTLALLRHPDALRRLRASPELLASAIEELLRYDSPVQTRLRIVTRDVELGGRRLRRGDRVLVLLGAANRDPERFADPDHLDFSRADNRHLAFGYGAHFCLGARLARLEAALAFEALLARFPDLVLAAGEIAWRETTSLRGLKRLAVTVA